MLHKISKTGTSKNQFQKQATRMSSN